MSLDWPLRSSLIIYSLAGVGIFLAPFQIALDLVRLRRLRPSSFKESNCMGWRTGEAIIWLLSLIAGNLLVGLYLSLPIFSATYALRFGAGRKVVLWLACLAEGYIVFVFDQMLHVIWPDPL